MRIEIGVSDERLHELFLGARGVYFGPFDEDYGYVTSRGSRRERPVVTTTDAGGPLEFVAEGETGFVASPIRARSPRVRRAPARRDGARRMGKAGNELIREVVPTWPQIVARLLD